MASSNNTYDTATLLTTPSGLISGLDNVGAGTEAGEPDVAKSNSLWFVFKLSNPVASVEFRQGVATSGPDLYLFLYRMAKNPVRFNGWTLVASNDDGAGDRAGLITLPTLDAGFYAVKWSSYNTATTTVGTLSWSGLTSIDPAYTPNEYTYVPAYGLGGSELSKVAGSYVVRGNLDRWYTNPYVPMAETRLSDWLMEDAGYVKPPPSSGGGGGPTPMPASGRGWPR